MTTTVRRKDAVKKFYLLDAKDVALGRVSTVAAALLRGKADVDFSPHVGGKDTVIIVNVSDIKFTGNKAEKKMYYDHSGYPGGLRETSLGVLFEKKPLDVVKKAVYGMLPKNRLRKNAINRLKVFMDKDHPYAGERIKEMQV